MRGVDGEQTLIGLERLPLAVQVEERGGPSIERGSAGRHDREGAVTARERFLVLITGEVVVAEGRLSDPFDGLLETGEEVAGQFEGCRARHVVERDLVAAAGVDELHVRHQPGGSSAYGSPRDELSLDDLRELSGLDLVERSDVVLGHGLADGALVDGHVGRHAGDEGAKVLGDLVTAGTFEVGNHHEVAAAGVAAEGNARSASSDASGHRGEQREGQ